MRGFRTSWLLSLFYVIMSIGAQQEQHCGPHENVGNYDWEKFNYYAILDLPSCGDRVSRQKRSAQRLKYGSKDVRRAYRRQAQLYHPDKRNNTISIEESNDRFARIAEAYEVIGDDAKRADYDKWLLDCEDYLDRVSSNSVHEGKQGSEPWSVFENLRATDPRRVFEEFFFGSSGTKDDMFGNMFQSSRVPVRVHEHREVMHDNYGNKIIRVFQTTEYAADSESKYFYQVLGQDFVERYERFHGWAYHPVSQQFVVEEGYRYEPANASSSGKKYKKDTLFQGEVMTSESTVLSSRNSRYYAGITADCELVIMSDSTQNDAENVLIWSSKTFLPPFHSSVGCFLTLRGPHLVLAAGNPDRPGTILWHSDVPESIIVEGARLKELGESEPVYFVRLDNDGVLAVYSKQTMSIHTMKVSTNWVSKMIDKADSVARIKASIVSSKLHKLKQKLLKVPENETKDEGKSRESSESKEICIYGTGIAGCNVVGRKLLELVQGTGHSVKWTLNKLDSVVDSILEFVQGDSDNDEDDDTLDLIIRILGRTTNTLSKAYQKIAQKGANAIRQALDKRKAKRMS